MTEVFDVFLSHSHVDAVQVESLGSRLEDQYGFRVWLDRWILVPGKNWQQEIAKALEESRTCAVCIGKHTPRGWFQQEIEHALNRQAKDTGFRVIPVMLPDASHTVVDGFLQLRTWVDFTSGFDDATTFHTFVSGIRGVPPGRGPTQIKPFSVEFEMRRELLLQVRQLRNDGLIDESVALEAQRKILDPLIEA
jgi:hypothetical protein